MVWLSTTNSMGNSLYLEVRCRERKHGGAGPRELVTATIGDGSYEGEVLIGLGARVDITFVDRYFAPQELEQFFSRIDLDQLREALAAEFSINQGYGDRHLGLNHPHVAGQRCSEPEPVWQIA